MNNFFTPLIRERVHWVANLEQTVETVITDPEITGLEVKYFKIKHLNLRSILSIRVLDTKRKPLNPKKKLKNSKCYLESCSFCGTHLQKQNRQQLRKIQKNQQVATEPTKLKLFPVEPKT